ncbi:calmodulin-binding transcription activator 5 [Forsythia ovata]|uniref:Calmodulin-binding transcription activator 5 n=1 Tax=Forsythia ovata TaxID=205694 RepID=A0ABD1RMI2_9LAMI
MPGKNAAASTFTHTVRAQTYTFLIDDPFAYFAIFDQSTENLKGLAFLKRVNEAFDVVFNGDLEKKKLERLTFHWSLEHIVLVHYRETQEGSPATPVNSNSCSVVSEPSAHWPLSEESDSTIDRAYYNISQLDTICHYWISNPSQSTIKWPD